MRWKKEYGAKPLPLTRSNPVAKEFSRHRKKEKVTRKKLWEMFNYKARDGGLYRRHMVTTPDGKHIIANKGDVSGYVNSQGHVMISINGKSYKATSLIWLMVYGRWPEGVIRHKDGRRWCNKLENLYEDFRSRQNRPLQRNNTSGVNGVSKSSSRWAACIGIGGKTRHLGTYPTKLEAALARLTAEICEPRWSFDINGPTVEAIESMWPKFNKEALDE